MDEAHKCGSELSSVSLLKAVLCADCEFISNSPGERCQICGSRSLLSLGRVLGGSIEGERAALVEVGHDQPRYGFTVLVNPAASRMLQRRRRKPIVTGS
jgi:DNA-directed RNA polymerase subunit RPC12/RpoP